MSDLAQKECVPCKGGIPPLTGRELTELQEKLGNGWQVVAGHHLEKESRFKDFRTALAFTNRVGELAEAQGHHPDIHLSWGRVKLVLWTHKIDGLTESDFIFAAKVERAERATSGEGDNTMTKNDKEEKAMVFAEPQPEHQWLQKFVGEWTFETEAIMEPGQPPAKSKGQERVRSLGGLWVLVEGEGEMPCDSGVGYTLLTLGYDPQKKKYVGTWVGSMMTHLWIYDGTLDAAGKVLTLATVGPDMAGGMAKYQDVYEFKSDDHRVLTSHMLGADGKWSSFMTANYWRKK